ncbi:hypothetical protein RhiirC2_795374 [Rhizophagus irregularis]|uniref:F-box domain-containing protein n=1 Tax=Rhizophagus irregularis TaxID=588596 RepID=A0A2N1MBP1_9GLOM|nr:hypothetical protein RhiirC2_795374 [Rhizophagus irregularis]
MSQLSEDILYLVFKVLKDDKKTLYSCLLTNRTWCRIAVPILWKNPWNLKDSGWKQMLNVIISHLSNESRNILKNICIDLLPFLTNPYQNPLFDYISFCRHLDLVSIDYIILKFTNKESNSILTNEIINLFINGSRKFTHLYIPYNFNFQIHLIPEVRSCLSEIEFLSSQQNLFNLDLKSHYLYDNDVIRNLENSLIKHANTIQYLKISKGKLYKKVLASFINLKVLELDCGSNNWECLENLSLPYLQILRTKNVPIKSLISLIENTKGYLIEIKIDSTYHNIVDNKRIIQVIYEKCPNLIFLKSVLRNNNILEFENLLVNCQNLTGLYILTNEANLFIDDYSFSVDRTFDWDKLFEILNLSSPISLFKFKFKFNYFLSPKLNSLKLFFDNWKDRHSIYLQLSQIRCDIENLMVEKYKSGIVKRFNNMILNDEFEWI